MRQVSVSHDIIRNMMFDDKEECIRLANRILQNYNRMLKGADTIKLLQVSENITYLVEHTENTDESPNSDFDSRSRRVIVRLCRPAYHSEEELLSEIRWMLELQKQYREYDEDRQVCGRDKQSEVRFSLRQPLAGDDGQYLYQVEDRKGQVYYGMLFTYLTGMPLENLTLSEQTVWFERLGEVTALFHTQTKGWKEASELPRFHWNYETMIGRQAVWGDWREVFVPAQPIKSGQGIPDVLNRADKLIYQKLQEYGVNREKYGLIHGDLRGANLLIEEDRLKIIDFDDCGFGWYMQDLAASLSFIETEEAVPELIKAWIAGYRKQGTLTREDLDMISTFIMMRRLQLLAWIYSRTNAASAITYREKFAEGTVELAEKYLDLHG